VVALTPRHTPSWTPSSSGREEFLGYVGDFDIYYEDHDDDTHIVYVVGPPERQIRSGSPHNFDPYQIDGDTLRLHDEIGGQDLHLDLHDMCQLYQLAVEHGYITNED
jgi:hypothetical protein